MTYMWKETRKSNRFRFQTDEQDKAKLMAGNKDFKLSANGINTNLWIYIAEFNSIGEAMNSLKKITNRKIYNDINKDIYCS